MPYKNSKIIYGLPQDAYAQQTVNETIDDLKSMIHLTYEPVGVKLIFTADTYNAFGVAEVHGQIPYCVMVKHAALGKSSLSRLENHKCDGATTALALEKSSEKIENGSEYFSYHLYASQTAARRLRQKIVSLHTQLPLTYGILVQPLKEFTQAPDVVICIINPYQAMRLVQGYEYEAGIKPVIDIGAMQALCSECTATPYITGNMNVSVLCPSTRVLCGWEQSDMAAGIPFEQFTRIVSGVAATSGSLDK